MTSERRLAAIMFTDMVGYSSLTHENEALAHELLEEHRRLIRPLFTEHNGTEIKTIGDAFHIEFASALHAVRCAIKIQGMLHGHNLATTPERKIQIRIGIHVGDVDAKEGDIYGEAVNIAARIEPLADPGGICISRAVNEQVHGKLGTECISLGYPDLKNIEEPIEVYKIILPSEPETAASGQERITRKAPRSLRIAFVAALIIILAVGGWWLYNNAPFSPGTPTLAVLAFSDLSPNRDYEHLGDGISEELINALTKLEGLIVKARTSSFSFKGTNETIRSIGQQLVADFVLEGSVRIEGDALKITAQLIRVSDESHLWSEVYDRELHNLFAIQEEIARAIVDELRIRLTKPQDESLVKSYTDNAEAYNFYQLGRFFWNKRSKEGLQSAIEYFEDAIALEPDYAPAFAGIADSYLQLASYEYLPPEQAYEKAYEHVLRALELDDDFAEAHATLGQLKRDYEKDYDGAEEEYRRALELSPGYYHAHTWYAILLLQNRLRYADSLAHIEIAAELDPFGITSQGNLGVVYMWRGEFERATQHYEKLAKMHPGSGSHLRMSEVKQLLGDFEGAEKELLIPIESDASATQVHTWYSNFLINVGRLDEAIDERQIAVDLSSNSPITIEGLGWAFLFARQYDNAIEQLRLALELNSPRADWVYLRLGQAYCLEESYEEALAALQQAKEVFDAQDPWINPQWNILVESTKGVILARMGMINEAEDQLEELMNQPILPGIALSYHIARVYAALGNIDQTFEYVKRSLNEHNATRLLLKVDPFMDEIRPDPRYQQMLEKMGLAK